MSKFQNQESAVSSKRNLSLLKWTLQSLTIGLLAVATLGVWIFARYGSPEVAIAVMNGQPLLAESKDQSFGELAIGQRIIREIGIRNITNHPVQLIGAKSSCTCAVTENLPLTIPPGVQRKVKLTATIKGEAGPWVQTIRLFTDAANESQISLRLTGKIRATATAKQ